MKRSNRLARSTGAIDRWVLILICAAVLVPAPLAAQPNVQLTYLGEFGSPGREAGQFLQVRVVDVDNQDRIWVLDQITERVQVCDVQGSCEFYKHQDGSVAQFFEPVGLVVDDLGRVLVLEYGNHRALICDNPMTSCDQIGGFGTSVGEFVFPQGLALSSENRIIVADNENRRVQQCDYAGNCSAFGKFARDPGETEGPGVWWSPYTVAADDQGGIFVGEVNSPPGGPPTTGFIHTCNIKGECSVRWGGWGRGVGDTIAPNGMEPDNRGNVFVADTGNNRIQVCDYQGLCKAFGEKGTGELQFDEPAELSLDSKNRLFVADQWNRRIQVLQVTYPGEDPPFTINPGLNDAWYNPLTSGQGVVISVFPAMESVFLAWFTYDTERPPEDVTAMLGEPGHRWLTAQGSYEGDTAYLTIYETVGGVFDAAEPKAVTDPAGDGTITLEFADCTEALMSYEITSLGISGDIPLERIVTDNVARCEELADP